MKTNYSKRNDNDLCADRLNAFLSDISKEDRRSLNAEFAKRFPRMMEDPNKKPTKVDLPPWMTDETPYFPEVEVPSWQREAGGITKKFSFKKKAV